jgi:hypothetical protein
MPVVLRAGGAGPPPPGGNRARAAGISLASCMHRTLAPLSHPAGCFDDDPARSVPAAHVESGDHRRGASEPTVALTTRRICSGGVGCRAAGWLAGG